MKSIKDGIIGFAIGDALGVPAEFKSRDELKRYPITDMKADGTYNVPAGTWSDDTSMTLATLDSIIEKQTILKYNNIILLHFSLKLQKLS